jgi:RNA polymerase sigma factor (sigma-70 family)
MTANEGEPVTVGAPPQFTFPTTADPASLVTMRTAWIRFYGAEYHAVVRCVMRTGASLDDACDAASQAFLESWALMTSKPERWVQIGNQRAWIRVVALRKHQRPAGTRSRPPLDANAAIPDLPGPGLEPGELTAQTQVVLAALRSLDPRARAVMALHLDDFRAADIARALDLTEQQARDLIKKARAHLKQKLAAMGILEGRLPQ